MIDYSEGHLLMKKLVYDLYEACLRKQYQEARELCDHIVVAARMTRAQIAVQQEQDPHSGEAK